MRRALLALVVLAAVLAAPATAGAATWCGNDATERNRLPESVNGQQIRVVYAFPADAPDRFGALADAIVSDVEAIDAWWRREDPTRAPRFDLFPFPGCADGFGRLDLTRIALPGANAVYADARGGVNRLAEVLSRPPYSLSDEYAKYLVYYDGPTDADLCGVSGIAPRTGGADNPTLVYVQACSHVLGGGGHAAATAAHELLHSLGAVQRGAAPNSCPATPAHVCDDIRDVMDAFNRGRPLAELLLDVNRDDYYAHGGTWWDVRNSSWLYRLDVPRTPIAVALSGSGGTVTSRAPGIACPPACAAEFDGGSELQLQARPRPSFRFVRWSGGCSGALPFCDLVLGSPARVTATFGPARFALSVAVTGRGRVTSSEGAACAARCRTLVDADAAVRLRPAPLAGWRFVRWGGACRGPGACTVRMTQARSVTAVFRRV